MTAIPIKLNDSWTRNHVTELNISSNGIFSGCGISFDVWKNYFSFNDSSWYGAKYGGFSEGFIAISAPNISSSRKRLLLSGNGEKGDNISIDIEDSGIAALTNVELSQCDIHDVDSIDLEAIDSDRRIQNWISTQDNFTFAFPSRSNPLCDAIRIVLGVHQYYLNVDLDEIREVELANHLECLLARFGNIRVFSDPERKQISVSFRTPSKNFLKRILGMKDSVSQVLYSYNLQC